MKKLFRVSLILFLIVLPVISLAQGCGNDTGTSKYTRTERKLKGMYKDCQTIEVKDPQGKRGPINVEELPALGEITVDAVLKRSNGMQIKGRWIGTSLSVVFNHYGIAVPFKELKIEAWDGYVGRVDYDTATQPNTIFARLENGEAVPREDGPVRLVVGSRDGFFWVRMITSIEVIR